MRPLEGKVALVTGAAGGIGGALARALAARGAGLALLDRDREGLERIAAALPGPPSPPTLVEVDLRDREACERAVGRALEVHGGIDVLVNNAGISHRSLFAETSADVVRRVIEVNLFGAIDVTRAALPSLRARRGRIGVLTSVAGFAPLIGRSAYCASKHALHGFFDTLRSEVRPSGVSVTLVCPSFTRTAIEQRALKGDGTAVGEGTRAVAGRVLSPEEVAEKTVRAMLARRRLVLPSSVSRASWWLSRVAPRLYERLMLRSQASEFPTG